MASIEQAYYNALFARDFEEAQRLCKEVACTDAWTPDRLLREQDKCGERDKADRFLMGPDAETAADQRRAITYKPPPDEIEV